MTNKLMIDQAEKVTPVGADRMPVGDSTQTNKTLWSTITNLATAIFGLKTTANLTENTNLYYTDARANSAFDTRLALKNTDNLSEGTTNKYASTTNVNAAGAIMNVALLAGENLTAGNALRNGLNGTFNGIVIEQVVAGASILSIGITGVDRVGAGQTFLFNEGDDISNITVQLNRVNTPGDSLQMKIYNGIGGALVGTSTNTILGNTLATSPSFTNSQFNFSGLGLTPGTTYLLEITRTGALSNYDYYETNRNSTNLYSDGNALQTNGSGGQYSAQTGDIYFSIQPTETLTETITSMYKTDAFSSYKAKFKGFANSTVTSGNTIIINTTGVDNNQTGLTIDSDYYLSDTDGEISTSAGTNSVKVGKAMSNTQLLINTGGGF